MSGDTMRIPAPSLTAFSRELLEAAGARPEHAAVTAHCLVEADVRGVETHGVSRLPVYLERLRSGLIDGAAPVSVVQEKGATAVVDGANGLGPYVGSFAMERAIQLASEHGLGAVAVRRSNHFGIAAYYSLQAVQHGMIGIAMTNSAPFIAPTGGRESRLGTNPLAFAIPREPGPPLVMDMAMSAITVGRLRLARSRGETVPLGSGLDREGKPTDDPGAILDGGVIAPVGGPKGYGLALAVDVLAGVLSGGAYGLHVRSMYGDWERPNDCADFFMALDIGAFMPLDAFLPRIEDLSAQLKQTEPAPGVPGVLLPGEPEWRARDTNLREGIPLPAETRDALAEEARRYGVSVPW